MPMYRAMRRDHFFSLAAAGWVTLCVGAAPAHAQAVESITVEGDAVGIEILPGPPSPVYGAGKVGGLVNFLPKTAGASDNFGGEATVTYGSYSKRNAALAVSMPVTI